MYNVKTLCMDLQLLSSSFNLEHFNTLSNYDKYTYLLYFTRFNFYPDVKS